MKRRPQFGRPQPGREYPDRPAAFGVVDRDGRIALVQVKKEGQAPFYDLPGGAVDPGETPAEAVVREFAEEAGLIVEAAEAFAEADQYVVNSAGEAFNNRCTFFSLKLVREEAARKVEADHELVWMPPHPAQAELRHEAHAWAVHILLQQLYQRP
jgi:8-oxo-dGTP diphosphatase